MMAKKLYLKLNGEGYKISYPDSIKLYNDYCTEFRTGVDFLRNAGRLAVKQGYLHNLNGRRRYWILPDPADLAKYPSGREDQKYQARIGGIEREGGNFLIQSMNAEMTKTAMVTVRDHIKKNRIKATFFNQVYDEIVTFCHKDEAEDFAAFKKKAMIDAAHKWMKSIPMEVDGHNAPCWTK